MLTKLLADLYIISLLDDEPNDVGGMSSAELKAKFDEAANTIKDYINNTLIPELAGDAGAASVGIETVPGLTGVKTVQAALAKIEEQMADMTQGAVADESITSAKLAALAVTSAKLAAAAVETDKIKDGAVTSAKLADLGEGVEETLSSAINPTIRAIYNGKSIGENYSEEQISDWLYDGLVGAALGLVGQGANIATGENAKKNAELRSGEVDKAFELMTGKKAASEPQSVAEAQGDITTPPTPSNDAVTRPVELNSTINNNVETQNAGTQKNTAPNGTESTAVNDNPATHTAEENKIIADYKAAADENVISGIERARSLQDINYRNKFTVTLAETVGDRVVNLVKNATGLDVTGFKNQIKGNSIAHIDKRHGVNGTADHSMANIEDFGRINYVVENADRARLLSAGDVDSETWKLSREYRNADNSQAPLIRFEKRVDNTYYVVEAVPDSKANRMAVVSAYMETAKKEASSPKSVDAAEAAPRATPEASLEISETSDNSIPNAEENVNRGQAENSANADFRASESDNAHSAEKDQAYYVDLARKLKERGWSREDIKDATGFAVDEHGNVYDEDTGEVHYDAQEEADKAAWNRAAEDFGEKNRDTIHEATSKAADFKTFLEDEDFLKGFSDSRYTEISDSVTEFKSKLAGVGDGHTPFSEFADYYKAMKNSDILGDLYSERVNEQVQLAKELSDAAQKNPIPYNVDRYRSAATKAMQMASHYVEKASKVRTELNELTAAVKENGSKKKPYETQRNPSLRDEAKSAGEKLGADTFSIMDYMHTFGTSTLVDSVKQNMGSEYGAWMENYVKDVQDINQTRAKSRDNWWQKLNRNFQTAVLVGNPGTPFKQKGSMWLAMSELDPRAVAKAAVTSLNPGNQQMKAARDNPLLQFRAKGNIDSSITDALQDQSTLFGKMAAKSKVLKRIQNWIPAADVREVSKVYLASCYDVQMKNPGIDVNSTKFKEMVDETFQRASMRTQSQYTMNMRDEISRGDNDLLKSLTMFQTQQRTNFNNLMTALGEAKAAKGTEHASKANKARARALGGFVASNIAYGAMSVVADALRHKLKQYRDDDEEQQIDPAKIAIKVGESFLEGVGGTVIFGDTATNFITSLFSDEPFYENGVGAVGAINDAMSAAIKLVDNPSADNVRKTAGGIANLLGIPLNNAYTLLNSFGMYTADIINAMSRSKESGNILNELLKDASAADIAGKKKAGLYSISDDPADDALKIFDSIKKAVDKLPPDQFTYTDENGDEVSYELTKADKEQYRKDAEASYNSGMDALLASAGYGKLDVKGKKAVDKSLRDYAKNAAEQGYLDSKELDHDTGASAWMRDLSEDEVPKYLVAKQTLKGMYKDGKISDYAALDGYMDDLKNGFTSLTSAQQDALSDSFPRIKDIYDAAAHDIPSKKWAAVYDKYMELDKTREDGYNATDKATDLAAFIDKQGLTDAQANSLKEQFRFYSHIAAEPTRYERLIDAGYSPDKANELYYRLDNMSTDGNSNVSQAEAYARLSTMDDLTNAEKDAIWAIINSGWKTTYTKYDRYHRNDATTKTPNTGSKNGSSSTSSAEAYFRLLGLLK